LRKKRECVGTARSVAGPTTDAWKTFSTRSRMGAGGVVEAAADDVERGVGGEVEVRVEVADGVEGDGFDDGFEADGEARVEHGAVVHRGEDADRPRRGSP